VPEGVYVEPQGLTSQNSALQWVGWLFFVFALFPAVSLIPLPIQTDTQPNALLAATLVFLVGRRVPLPLSVWTLLVPFAGALILFIAGGLTINGVRSMLGYTTVFIVAAAALVLAASDIRLSDKLLDYSVYVWTFVGAVQRFLWRPFMTFLIAASRESDQTRGVPSLSNEPSLYAMTMIFFIIFYFMRKRERSFPVFLCMVQVVLFSESVLGVLFVIMMLGLYALIRFSAPKAIVAVLALFAVSFALFMYGGDLLAGTRIGGLLLTLKHSPQRILLLDQSVSTRFTSIFYSLKGAVDNVFVPHGFGAWTDYAYRQDMIYRGIFRSDADVTRIMSGYGTALFEMGWIGLTIPIVITVGVVKSVWRDSPSRAIIFLLVVHLLLLSPVPLSFPLVGLLIGELFSHNIAGSRIGSALPAKPTRLIATDPDAY
jgi:hypothetical protein